MLASYMSPSPPGLRQSRSGNLFRQSGVASKCILHRHGPGTLSTLTALRRFRKGSTLLVKRMLPSVFPNVQPKADRRDRHDMSAFASWQHLSAWARVCAGIDESTGKRRSGRTGRGNEVAPGRTDGGRERYCRCPQRNFRAFPGVAHSSLTAASHARTAVALDNDLGDDFTRRDPERISRRPVRQLEALGHQLRLTPKSRPRRWPSDASPTSTLLLRRMMQARFRAARRPRFSISLQAQITEFAPPPRPYWPIEPRLARHLATRCDYWPQSRSEMGLEGAGQSYRDQRGAAIALTAARMAADTTCRLPRHRQRQRIEHA